MADLDARVAHQLDQSDGAVDALVNHMAALIAQVGEVKAWSSVAVRYAAEAEAGPAHLAALASTTLIRLARERCSRRDATYAVAAAFAAMRPCEPDGETCYGHAAEAAVEALRASGWLVTSD